MVEQPPFLPPDGAPQPDELPPMQPPRQRVPEVVPIAVPWYLPKLSNVAQATRLDYPEAAEPARLARCKVDEVWNGSIGATACVAVASGLEHLFGGERNAFEDGMVTTSWIGVVVSAAFGLKAYMTARSLLLSAFELRDAAIEADLRRRYAATP